MGEGSRKRRVMAWLGQVGRVESVSDSLEGRHPRGGGRRAAGPMHGDCFSCPCLLVSDDAQKAETGPTFSTT